MFALCAAPQGGIAADDLAAMAAVLRGAARRPAVWCAEGGRAGACAATPGLLPEDAFDRQPLVSPELLFVAQARLDNRDELLAKLGVPRERWATLADSDVLHEAWRRWEEDCVQHAYGDYAFAAWHRESGCVVAAVDHLACARLYYAQSGGLLILSTQLGALLAHPQAPRDLDLNALGLLAAPKIEAGSTPFKDVRLLRGGHMLIARQGRLESLRWWRPDTAVRTHYRDPRDYVAAARDVFDEAVKARLRAVSNVAALMSGGLDSTLVSATAARQLREQGRTITAYLSVPEPGVNPEIRSGWDADDSPYAVAVAQMHDNLNPAKVAPGRSCALDIVPQIHAVSRTPMRNGPNHIWIGRACASAAASGARVILGGLKGNATISQPGDGALRDSIRQLKWGAAVRHAGLYARNGSQAAWRALAREILGDDVRKSLQRMRGIPNHARRFGAPLFTDEFRAANAAALDAFAGPITTRGGQIDFMMLSWHQWSADPMAQWSTEIRDPTGDRRLIECLLSFPPEVFSTGGWPRGLARAMGEGRIPDSVRFRCTRGEQMPEYAGLLACNAAKYREALARVERSATFRSIFDVEHVRATLDRVCEGRAGRPDADAIDRVIDVGLFIAESDSVGAVG